ncbi:hypothetical protein Tco_0825746 [Tanacetum coccineum]
MTASKSFNKHPKHKALYHALMESILANKEAIDQGVADIDKQNKRKPTDDDKDEDPPAGPDQGLKRRKTSKDTEPSKRSKSNGKSVNNGPTQNWVCNLAKVGKPSLTFNELMSTPIDFFVFAMNNLQITNLTKVDLEGPVYNLLKGTCKSYVELEYNMEECYKALNDQLDWNNLKGDRCPFDLSKPLPLVESRGRQFVIARYFFNYDLEYLREKSTDRKYTTSINKTKAANYELKGIKDMVPTLWSPIKVAYDKHVALVTNVKVNKWYGYGHLEEIKVKRADHQLYKFIKGDFPRLHLNDIEDMLLLVVPNKLFNLNSDVIVDLAVALHPQGVIYEDKLNRKRLMHSDELHKFSDGTLQSVQDTLHDMANNLRMRYNKAMLRRRWSNLDKKRSHIMVKDIDRRLLERRWVLTDPKVNPTKHGRMTKPYSSTNFIANYFIVDSNKDEHGDLEGMKNRKMPIEFVTWLNETTYPDQVIPEVYNEEAFNGNRVIYIISSEGYRYKVTLETSDEGLWYLTVLKWTEFCNRSLNEIVALLHFVEEGDDFFSVTGYNRNSMEVGGYGENRATFARFMTRVLPYTHLHQTMPVEFLPTLNELGEIVIEANAVSTMSHVRSQELILEPGTYAYQLSDDDWNRLVEALNLEGRTIQWYREREFIKYCDLISCLLAVEQNNELLMKNHESRPTGSAPLSKENVVTYNQSGGRGCGSDHGRGRGRRRGHGQGRGFGRDAFTDLKRVTKSHTPAANAPIKIDVPKEHSEMANESKAHLKRETLEGSSIRTSDLTVQEEPRVPENEEISINYVMSRKIWNRNEIKVDDTFAYNVALKVMENGEDHESNSVPECKNRNDWPK